MQGQQVELLVNEIQAMDRDGLIRLLRNMQCDFAVDFTDDFLNSISVERLRHIALAASLHAHAGKRQPA
jgi:hypothetical protein